ncbi:Ig-like domain repeat protein [Caldivirga maquilingensis]|uniref:Uncharacterized protein n=1 Tax=Caldivirga maquilingensis (strain ATCC 700844 / DSM 13496 / JCM 10307 / IC-167) TaxID=397948 RepID=A8MDS4_CALMQ|nr:Ig-like domain repeat protein [Caldivirga maquilingensis]ABW01930.1 hypothetical protein Cmaq_1102 [Caldivirga maquilingensis IC-167]
MRKLLLILVLAMASLAIVANPQLNPPGGLTNATHITNYTKPVLNITLSVNLISLTYENWVKYPVNNVVSTPLNYFTLLINASIINSTEPINESTMLSIRIGNVYSYSTLLNLTAGSYQLVNVPVYSLPYGNYSINVTLSVMNFTTSRFYNLIMYKPTIVNAYLTQCGLTTSPSNNSEVIIPYSSPILNLILYSAEPVKLNLVSNMGGVYSSYNVTINGKYVFREPLTFMNGTVSAQLAFNGQAYSTYMFQVNSVRPWYSINVTYGSASLRVTNGSSIPVVTGHSVNFYSSYLSNLTMETMINNQVTGNSFLIVDTGSYNAQVVFMYGSCTVGLVKFSINAYEPVPLITSPNSTVPLGVNSRIVFNVNVPAPIVNEKVYISPLSPQFPVSITGSPVALRGNGGFEVGLLALQPGPMPLNVSLIMVDYGGYSYYYSTIILLNVLKPTMSITPELLNITYGELASMLVNLTAEGYGIVNQTLQYQVTLNGVNVALGSITTNSSGYASLTFKPNDTGVYVVYVTYSPSQSFSITSQAKVIVAPAKVNISYLVNSTIVYGDSLTVMVNLNPGITASVYLYLNKSFIGYINVINGTGYTHVKPNEAGYFNLTIYYPGSRNYLPSVAEASLMVLKAPCTIRMSINGSFIVGSELSISGNVTAPISQIPIYVNKSLIIAYVTNGKFQESYKPPYPGLYNITVYWPGNNNYLSCGLNEFVKVIKANPRVSIRVLNNGTIASGSSIIMLILIKVNNNLPTRANASILVNSSGRVRSINTVVSNETVLRIVTDKAGPWIIYVKYLGNEWLNDAYVGPIVVYVVSGVFGIPWYIFTIYALAIIMGLIISLLMRHS